MDSQIVKDIRESMEAKSTEELLKIWEENDKGQFTYEAFEIVKQLLIARGGTPPPQKSQREKKFISETLPKGQTPIWKMILCVILFLPGGFYIVEMLKYLLYDIFSGAGPSFIKNLFLPFLVLFIAMWGATFLWPRWPIVIGSGCVVWGFLNIRAGIWFYVTPYLQILFHIRSGLDESIALGMGIIMMVLGIGLVGNDIYKIHKEKATFNKNDTSSLETPIV